MRISESSDQVIEVEEETRLISLLSFTPKNRGAAGPRPKQGPWMSEHMGKYHRVAVGDQGQIRWLK